MKKEEIIKNLIMGNLFVPENIQNVDYNGNRSFSGIPELVGSTKIIVDIDKLANFLAKYVVKEDLIID